MTSQRELDRLLDFYFDDGRDELADRVIDAALDDIDHTRQRRAMRVPWRSRPMTMPLRLATAALIGALVLGGAFLLTGGGSKPSTAVPTASPGPAWTVTGAPSVDRGNARLAIQLKDGRVLQAGGSAPTSAELYDPATGKWTATGPLSVGRGYAIVTRLADGKVLVAGGSDGSGAEVEVYDPVASLWTRTGDMIEGRGQGFGVTLADGRVLAAGGGNDGGKSSAELYDPATGRWSPTGSMTIVRAGPLGVARLADGRVLVTGGFADQEASAEIYDPTTGRWTATAGQMTAGRKDEQSSITLSDGRVLVCGGVPSSCDLFDPAKGTFTATGPLKWSYSDLLVLNQLTNGKVVLVAGGSSGSATGMATAQLFDPTTATWTAVDQPMGQTKYVRSAHLLPNGTVLVVGSDTTIPAGTSNLGGTPTAELYRPAP
ncbi:MAG: Kelch repeat-containing protein [Chloroflexota bacterium]